jgi:hypothetical protein
MKLLGMGKKHRGLVAPRPTGSLGDESKRSSSGKKKRQKVVVGWMQPKQFWLPAQGEVFFA